MAGAVETLGLEPGIIAVVGSGGKTSLLKLLGRQLVRAGERVVLTTTTHILAPSAAEGRLVLVGKRVPGVEFADKLRGPRPVWVAARARAGGKLRGLEPWQVQGLAIGARWVVVEADGARGKPLKAWAEYEPALPEGTHTMVVVIGAWGLGRKLDEASVHRPELFAEAAGMALGQKIGPDHVAKVVLGSRGPLRAMAPGTRVVAVVNHGGRPGAAARMLAEHLGKNRAIARVVSGDLRVGGLEIAWRQ